MTSRPRAFAYLWHPYNIEKGVDYSGEPRTRAEFSLEPVDAGTRFTVVETGFGAIPEHRRAAVPGADDGGWGGQVKAVKAYVEG